MRISVIWDRVRYDLCGLSVSFGGRESGDGDGGDGGDDDDSSSSWDSSVVLAAIDA